MNTAPQLENLRDCFEGIVPACIATCDLQGMPNVTYVSQAMYVDHHHIALSFQFFNKTRENILHNPIATLLLMDPFSAARYRLLIQYLRTETNGAVFERMRAKLAGIAAHEGMVGVFKLQGADLYRVLSIEHVPGRELAIIPPGPALWPALRNTLDTLATYHSMESLLDSLLECLERHFNIRQSIVLMHDVQGHKLFTVASRGYPSSGVGSEIPMGVGLIGIAAQQQVPIRSMFAAVEYNYTRAVREQVIATGQTEFLEEAIPLPGLAKPSTQLAVPIVHNGLLLGVLYVESEQACRFTYDGEDALMALCAYVGGVIHVLQLQSQSESMPATARKHAPADQATHAGGGHRLKVSYYGHDHSIFLDNDYLIKGVAGAILWRLLELHNQEGRTEFSNRELRLDPRLPLPDMVDNLDARLLLLSRRLQERSDHLVLDRFARGKLRLVLDRPVELVLQRA